MVTRVFLASTEMQGRALEYKPRFNLCLSSFLETIIYSRMIWTALRVCYQGHP